jgi:hypothetical protein
MSALALDPGPDDGDGATAKGDRNHQQAMVKTHLGTIDNQSNLPVLSLTLEQGFTNRAVPFAHTYLVLQQSFQSLYCAVQFGGAWQLGGDHTQMNLTTQVDAYQQPGEVVNELLSCLRAKLPNLGRPGMI